MTLSREAKLLSALTLLTVPTIMYGGLTLLGILTQGSAGIEANRFDLNETQWALWRAGHAHAGVWVILSLVMQVLIDGTRLSRPMKWLARLSAPIAAIGISGGFFGVSFVSGFRWLLYFGGTCMLVAVILTGVGLLRNLHTDPITT